MDKSPRLEGQEWQRWATQLLHRRYPAGEYQSVPDKRDGDAGIEGFSLDGCVYQMYGPESELTFEQRHTKLRDKMTRDVRKFIDNKEKLSRLLGTQMIRRWILFVPSFDDRQIVEHAGKKTTEVLNAALPYVDKENFKVVVIDEGAFSAEKTYLVSHAVAGIVIDAEPIDEDVVNEWSRQHQNTGRSDTLALKVAKLPTLKTERDRQDFQREVVRWWLEGQNILEELRDYPEMWESIRRAKSEQEKYLKGHCMITTEQPYRILMNALGEIDAAVEREAKALAAGSRKAVAHEAVADWLMRCPLDFPEPAGHD